MATAVIGFAPACAWHLGAPSGSFAVGTVDARTVEPGLRPVLQGSLASALSARNVDGDGPVVDVRIVSVEHAPEAALSEGGAVVFAARMVVRYDVSSRSGCSGEVTARRTWLDASSGEQPLSPADGRDQAVRAAAEEAAERIMDALLADPECR